MMQWVILAAAAAAIHGQKVIADSPQDLEARTSGIQLATFDDLTSNSPVPVPYKGLNWPSITATSDNGGTLTVAQSKPNFAGYSAQSSPVISTQGTKTKSFDLDSLYFGCFDTRSLIATACNFTVTGLQPSPGRHHGPYFYTYIPAASGNQPPMLKVSLGWTGLNSFYTQVVADDTKLVRTYQTLDNVKYTVHE